MLRGKLLTLVNGYPLPDRVTEWSSLHIWRRRTPKSWVRIQPSPLSLRRTMCVKKTLSSPRKRQSILDEKRVWPPIMGNGPDHLPSRCQCRRVSRGKLLTQINGCYYHFICDPTVQMNPPKTSYNVTMLFNTHISLYTASIARSINSTNRIYFLCTRVTEWSCLHTIIKGLSQREFLGLRDRRSMHIETMLSTPFAPKSPRIEITKGLNESSK